MPGYAKQRSNWQDYPTTSTPITAANLNGLETAIYDLKKSTFKAKDYGADPAGTAAANATAIASAITDIPSTGGILEFDSGVFGASSLPSLSTKRNIIVKGQGSGFEFGGYGTTIQYTGTATVGWDWSETVGCRMEGIQLLYNNASFTGTLLDLTRGAGTDARYSTFRDCVFAGNGVTTAAQLLKLKNTHSLRFEDCSFLAAQLGVLGRPAGADFANVVNFQSCLFMNNIVAHVKNAGQAWEFDNCTFEPLDLNKAGAYTHDAGVLAQGLTYNSCWFGDATSGTAATWIKFGGDGLILIGGAMGAVNAAQEHILIDENNCEGIMILGTTFVGPGSPVIDFGSTTGHAGVVILPGGLDSVGAITAGTVPPGALVRNAAGLLSERLDSVAGAVFFDSLAHQFQITTISGAPGIVLGSGADTNLYRINADVLGTDDDFSIFGVGKGLRVKEGTNAKMGTATMNGTTGVVVSTTAVTANSRIFLSYTTGAGTVGSPYVSARTAGTSFSVKSTTVGDTSTCAWMLVEPA